MVGMRGGKCCGALHSLPLSEVLCKEKPALRRTTFLVCDMCLTQDLCSEGASAHLNALPSPLKS